MMGLTPVSRLTSRAHLRGHCLSPHAVVVLRLPVEDQDALVHVSAHIVDEEPGFGLRVASARVMVDAGLLTTVDGSGELSVRVGVDAVGQATTVHAAGTPCGADDDEIGRHGRGVDAALPVRDVVPVHVGHRRRGERHGDCDGERGQRRAPASAGFHVLRLAFVEDVQIPLLPAPIRGNRKGHLRRDGLAVCWKIGCQVVVQSPSRMTGVRVASPVHVGLTASCT